MKKPTLKEKVEVYEALFHQLNFHRTLTMKEKGVMRLMGLIDAWSYAHRVEGTEEDRQKRIAIAFDDLRRL